MQFTDPSGCRLSINASANRRPRSSMPAHTHVPSVDLRLAECTRSTCNPMPLTSSGRCSATLMTAIRFLRPAHESIHCSSTRISSDAFRKERLPRQSLVTAAAARPWLSVLQMYGAVNCAHVTGVSSYVIFHIIQGQDPPGENWSAAGEEDSAAGRSRMEISRKLVNQAATTDGVSPSCASPRAHPPAKVPLSTVGMCRSMHQPESSAARGARTRADAEARLSWAVESPTRSCSLVEVVERAARSDNWTMKFRDHLA